MSEKKPEFCAAIAATSSTISTATTSSNYRDWAEYVAAEFKVSFK